MNTDKETPYLIQFDNIMGSDTHDFVKSVVTSDGMSFVCYNLEPKKK